MAMRVFIGVPVMVVSAIVIVAMRGDVFARVARDCRDERGDIALQYCEVGVALAAGFVHVKFAIHFDL